MSGDALACEHANEVPSSRWCHCPSCCYCWSHACKGKTFGPAGLLESSEGAKADMAERFELLRWAGGRPDVLRFLKALRGSEAPAREVPRREAKPMPVPTIDPVDPPRVTIEDIDAPAHSWILGHDAGGHAVCRHCGEIWCEGRCAAAGAVVDQVSSLRGTIKNVVIEDYTGGNERPPFLKDDRGYPLHPDDVCVNCGLPMSKGKHVARGEGLCELPC